MAASHPLDGIGLTVRNFKSFGEEGGRFGKIRPINIIIGRNNTGKSALIDAVNLCLTKGSSFSPAAHARGNALLKVEISQAIDEASLRRVFSPDTRGGGVPGRNHWEFAEQQIGQEVVREYRQGWQSDFIRGLDFGSISEPNRAQYLNKFAKALRWPFDGMQLLRISAERDVQPELKDDQLTLSENGTGTTNLIRAFINSVRLPRQEVEEELLADLNSVYRGDSVFTWIACQEDEDGRWEIYLREAEKGDIRLSQSGSSLKSIFITLSLLRLLPHVITIDWTRTVVAIEEPENNLHPSLLRRLLTFLAETRKRSGFTLFITTHSPVGIDWSAKREDSQIIHVKHDRQAATSAPALSYVQGKDILDDLDVRASDLLQANGVIWVEGPSDRIYLRRWIELVSGGLLKEDAHYTIMFYGGKLLARLSGKAPEEVEDFISLIRINRNAAILIDSDRHPKTEIKGKEKRKQRPRMSLNQTKMRIKGEVESVNGFAWITEGREIENYIPLAVYERIVGRPAPEEIDIYTELPKHAYLNQFRGIKIDLAHAVEDEINADDIKDYLDLWDQLERLCDHIRRWNSLNQQ